MPTESSSPTISFGSSSLSARSTGEGAGLTEYTTTPRTNDPADVRIQNRPGRTRRRQLSLSSSGDRHALAEHLEEALLHAKKLEAAIASKDLQQAAISGMDLRQSLRDLWNLRHIRTDDWSTNVNKLQVVTSRVEFEKFTAEMAMAVRMVVETHLRPDVDNDDIRAVTVLLERAGFHPWKSIANSESEV